MKMTLYPKMRRKIVFESVLEATTEEYHNPGRIWYRNDLKSIRFALDEKAVMDIFRVKHLTPPWLLQLSNIALGNYPVDIDISPDGKFLAIANPNDHKIQIYLIPNLEFVANLIRDNAFPFCCRFSPDGKYLGLAETQRIILVSIPNFNVVAYSDGTPSYLDFSRSGKYLAVNQEGVLKLLSVPNLEVVASKQIDSGYYIRFSPNEKYLAMTYFGDANCVLELFSVPALESLKVINLISEESAYIDFSPNGKYLAVVDCYNAIKLLSVPNLEEISRYEHSNVFNCSFSPDGKYIASLFGYPTNLVKIMTVPELQTIGEAQAYNPSYIKFSPDGKYLAIANSGLYPQDATVEIWI